MIPYNPSSFDTNKTLLENILELKKWLQDNPVYQVFYSSASGTVGISSPYTLSTITDNTDLDVGDVVVFSNSVFGKVLAVDRDNGYFQCDACVSFVGPQGPAGVNGTATKISTETYVAGQTTYTRSYVVPVHQVNVHDIILFIDGCELCYVTSVGITTFEVTAVGSFKGADGTNGTNGTDGVGVSNAEVDANGDLIITLTDTSQINAGYVVGPQGPSNPEGTAVLSTSETAGKVLTADGDNTSSWQSIPAQTPEGTAIKSTGETSGKVLTADGSGGASWQTAGGGTTLTQRQIIGQNTSTGARIYNVVKNCKGRVLLYDTYRQYNANYRSSDNKVVLSSVWGGTYGDKIEFRTIEIDQYGGLSNCCAGSINYNSGDPNVSFSAPSASWSSSFGNQLTCDYWNDTAF